MQVHDLLLRSVTGTWDRLVVGWSIRPCDSWLRSECPNSQVGSLFYFEKYRWEIL